MLIFPNLVINDIMAITVRTFMPSAPDQMTVSAWALGARNEDHDLRKRVSRLVESARKRTSETVFHKMTTEVDGRPRIVDQPPLLYHLGSEKHYARGELERFFDSYRSTLSPERRLLFELLRVGQAQIEKRDVIGVVREAIDGAPHRRADA